MRIATLDKDFFERQKAYDEAEKLASSNGYISNKDNPLIRNMHRDPSPFYSANMDMLRDDVRRREECVHGKVYAGLMDNMRYGGNE